MKPGYKLSVVILSLSKYVRWLPISFDRLRMTFTFQCFYFLLRRFKLSGAILSFVETCLPAGRQVRWLPTPLYKPAPAHAIAAIALLFSACTGTKKIPEDDKLYTGAEIVIQSKDTIPCERRLTRYLERSVRPRPNRTFLKVFRPRLWVHNAIGPTPKQKGIKHWLKTRLGEPPVLLSSVEPEKTMDLLINRLQNKGFFKARVDYEIVEQAKTASVTYTASLHAPYVFNEIFFPDSSTVINENISATRSETTLKEGDQYDLDRLKQERIRIDKELKEKGFFYFDPAYLFFEADTTIGNKRVNIYLTVKEDAPPKTLNPYKINDVYVHSGYTLTEDSLSPAFDTVNIDGYKYIARDSIFKPKVILNAITISKDSLYSRDAHNITLSKLTGLGTFKFVNIRFRDVDTTGTGLLNAHVYLTPAKKKTLRSEVLLSSKSNNFAGPGFDLSYRHRNLFRGAELFIFNLTSSFETQVTGTTGKNNPALNSYELGVESELHFPRFISPIKISDAKSRFIPKTRLQTGYRILNRSLYYRLRSFNAAYGFIWRRELTHFHELNPVSLIATTVGRTTPRFKEILDSNLFLKRSFEQQYILGSNYSYTYNNQIEPERQAPVYFNGYVDFSGGPFGSPWSQYVKLGYDFRQYFKITTKSTIAGRLITGLGIPYGNSTVLPYIKQYFVGGTNSVRAFRARSVGPGTYMNPNLRDGNNFFIDQAGDIKFEANLEYRFPIVGILKGALFTDAGNVWLLNKDPQRPGGEFNFSTFYNELAVGSGFGLRFDITFFVIRFDFAFPIRVPYEQNGEDGNATRVSLADRGWRRDNFVLNVAIGYPF